MNYPIPARNLLAISFPPDDGYNGALTTIQDLCSIYRFGCKFPTKWESVSWIVRASMESVTARGNGNRAKRRASNERLSRSTRQPDLLAGFRKVFSK